MNTKARTLGHLPLDEYFSIATTFLGLNPSLNVKLNFKENRYKDRRKDKGKYS